MEKVFISYHRESPEAKELAEQLFDRLTAERKKPFLDHKSIVAGDDWARIIYGELFGCDTAIIIVSRKGLEQSQWLRHEALLLLRRCAGWGDLRIFPVFTDLTREEVLQDEKFRLVTRLTYVDGRERPAASIIDEVLHAVEHRRGNLFSRAYRSRWFWAVVGLRHRARACQRDLVRVIASEDEVLRTALRATQSPEPPTDTIVDLKWYVAGLLAFCPECARRLLEHLPNDRARIERELGARGLLPSHDGLAVMLSRRFFWSLRRTFLASLAAVVGLSLLLLWATKQTLGYLQPTSWWNAATLSLFLVVTVLATRSLVFVVASRGNP